MNNSTDPSTQYTFYTFLDAQGSIIQEIISDDHSAQVFSVTHGWIELQHLINEPEVNCVSKSFSTAQLRSLLNYALCSSLDELAHWGEHTEDGEDNSIRSLV